LLFVRGESLGGQFFLDTVVRRSMFRKVRSGCWSVSGFGGHPSAAYQLAYRIDFARTSLGAAFRQLLAELQRVSIVGVQC
jgi:hypothetical protein